MDAIDAVAEEQGRIPGRPCEFVIVGGGPIGLWTAIQLKKRMPAALVTVYERHLKYQRNHILRLEFASLIYYSRATLDLREEAFLLDVTGKRFRQLVLQQAASVFIRTNELEHALLEYARTLGVDIRYQRVENPLEVVRRHPHCHAFIAADGARSAMRTGLMGEAAVEQVALQHVVELKYHAEGKAGALGSVAEHYKTNKTLTHMALEYVGRETGGATPVTLRFFVDRETYEALPESTFKAPLALDDFLEHDADAGLAIARLKADIFTYMAARRSNVGERYKSGTGRVTKVLLSLYAAERFALLQQATAMSDVAGASGRAWYLAGDAAMGVPFFRSLNAGLVIASQLAIILASDLSSANKVQAYNGLRPLHVSWEFTTARGKNVALKVYNLLRKVDPESARKLVRRGRRTAPSPGLSPRIGEGDDP